jgi:ketosteroid isomerase-like protein
MSNANVALVQSLYAAFGRGEIRTVVDAADPRCVWRIVGRRSDFPTFGEFNGQSGVRTFFDTVAEHLDFKAFTPREFHGADDKVFVLGHYAITVKKTGKLVDTDWCHVFTVQNGKVTAFTEFTDTAQAADAYRG